MLGIFRPDLERAIFTLINEQPPEQATNAAQP
jgi:hypothetical protein